MKYNTFEEIGKEIDQVWTEIEMDLKVSPCWENNKGTANFYFEFADEFIKELEDVENEISFFRELRKYQENKKEAKKIVTNLAERKGELKWKIKHYQSIGSTLLKEQRNERSEENQSSQLGLAS